MSQSYVKITIAVEEVMEDMLVINDSCSSWII